MPAECAVNDNSWFSVDKQGLAGLLAARGREWVAFELIANSWDEPGVTRVELTLEPAPGRRGRTRLTVEDDAPDGFLDLADAHRLFGSTRKRSDPKSRGRFNLGEKLVLAIADEAELVSTKGTVWFVADGTRRTSTAGGHRRQRGSLFRATVHMTKPERGRTLARAMELIPPPGIETIVNGLQLPPRSPVREVRVDALPTVIEVDGSMRRSARNAVVCLYEPRPGEVPSIYEMGVPIVENGDRWHYDVDQKVPLTSDRDNVPPAFLRKLRTAVLNATADIVTAADTTATWVKEAIESADADVDAVRAVITTRFGDKVVAADPSDREAEKAAVAHGYTVIHGGTFSRAAWASVRRAAAVKPAGAVFPTPRVAFSADGTPPISEGEWTPRMRTVAAHARALCAHLLDFEPIVQYHRTLPSTTGGHCSAAWGGRTLTLTTRVARAASAAELDALLLHEFAHHTEPDHLSAAYHAELCRLGARMRGAPAFE
jgi:hypothetical protein